MGNMSCHNEKKRGAEDAVPMKLSLLEGNTSSLVAAKAVVDLAIATRTLLSPLLRLPSAATEAACAAWLLELSKARTAEIALLLVERLSPWARTGSCCCC